MQSFVSGSSSCDSSFLSSYLALEDNPEFLEKLSVQVCSLNDDRNTVELISVLHRNFSAEKLIRKILDILEEV